MNFSDLSNYPVSTPIIICFPSDEGNKKIKDTYNAMRKIWKESGWKSLMPAHYDRKTGKIALDLTRTQLEGLAHFYEIFAEIIFFRGNPSHSIFSDYVTHYQVLYQRPDLFAFATRSRQHLFQATLHEVFPSLPQKDSDCSPKRTLRRWLDQDGFQGVIIGESHHDLEPKKFIVQQMKRLKAYGVETIFLEFFGVEEQVAIDNFLQSKSQKEIPPQIKAIARAQDEHYKYPVGARFEDIIQAAKKQGIRIVGMETEESKLYGFDKRFGHFGDPRARIMGFNSVATKIIEREKGDGKYLVLVGNGHVAKFKGIPGMSSLLGVPGMVIFDSDHYFDEPVKNGFNVTSPVEDLKGRFHAVFVQDKTMDLTSVRDHFEDELVEDPRSLYSLDAKSIFLEEESESAKKIISDEPAGCWLIRTSRSKRGSYVIVLKNQKNEVVQYISKSKEALLEKAIELRLAPELQITD